MLEPVHSSHPAQTRRIVLIVMILLGASVIGLAATRAPILASLTGLGILAVSTFIAIDTNVARVFTVALSFGLFGYMFLGRGFAYLGVPPVFVGELILLLAVLALISRIGILRIGTQSFLIIMFIVWGALRTIPYISRDGIFALRDGVVWGYALIALAIFVCFDRASAIRMTQRYGRLVPMFMIWGPLTFMFQMALRDNTPRIPISNVPILYVKPGDLGVHLLGVAAFLLLGVGAMTKATPPSSVKPLFWIFWLFGFALVASQNRGGFLSILLALAFVAIMRPSRELFVAAGAMVVLGIFLTALNPQIDIGRSRTVSPHQILANFTSIVDRSDDGPLQGTVDFRLEWWQDIWNYTVHGPYFWTGKGFGLNLSVDSNISIVSDVRAPHNTHVTILARMGVPGLLLWIGMNLSIAIALLRIYRNKSRGDPWLSATAGWLFLYWLAMMVNTSFDPYLEGPQGGIWYWSIVGIALVTIRMAQEPCLMIRNALTEKSVSSSRIPDTSVREEKMLS